MYESVGPESSMTPAAAITKAATASAVVLREEAYAEMVLAAAAKLQQEADQREAAYLQSVRAAQVAAQKQVVKYAPANSENSSSVSINVNVPLSGGGTSQNKKQITVR